MNTASGNNHQRVPGAMQTNAEQPADWQQREQGRDLDHSYIVQAPAGSGKTELLTQRMLALLSRVENPEEVVAITFTRKAAAEMSHRLIGRLQAAELGKRNGQDEPALAPHEQISRQLALAVLDNDARHNWNLLEQPSRLRIRTIDGLGSELARQLPVLSGLGSSHQIATDADALYHLAATRTMSIIENDSDPLHTDVTRVLHRYNNGYDQLVTLLTSMLASRDQWLVHLLSVRQGEGFDRQGLEQALNSLVENQLQDARDATADELLQSMPPLYRFAIANKASKSAELLALLNACGGEDCSFLDMPVDAESLPVWRTFVDSLFTKSGSMRKTANKNDGFPAPNDAKDPLEKTLREQNKAAIAAVFEAHRDNEALRKAAVIIRALPAPHYQDEAWDALQSLMRIMLRAAIELNLVMASSGEVDFGEIANRAIEALGSDDAPSELALRMDYRIQHLLVDEFQDTSSSQIRLLRRLTSGWTEGDGRSLFLVGDPMQSIYRFRKAEVSLFIKAWEGHLFDHIRLIPLRLSVNFRSTRPVVEWVNSNFPAVLPKQSDPVMGAVAYSPANTKPGVSQHGIVAVHLQAARDDYAEAMQMVDIIAQSSPEESIAVLVRSRSHAQALLAELDRKKLHNNRYRYQAIDFTPLAETIVIQDLVSLTLALLQPADRLAWLATLRAPYIGLDLNDMDSLVAGDGEAIVLDSLGAASVDNGKAALLSDNALTRLQRVTPILQQSVEQRGRISTRTLVESAWIKLGGPACVDNASELGDASAYFDLLDELEDQNLPIARDTLERRMQKLYAEPDTLANGKLQVLTIYSAKGLQFERVLLPGLNRSPAGDKPRLLHWFELAGEDSIVMSPMRNQSEKDQQKNSGDLITFVNEIEKQRKRLENGRLLYVAATRAIHSLHLFVSIKPNASDEIKPENSSLMVNLWPAIEHQYQSQLLGIAASLQNGADETGAAVPEGAVANEGAPDEVKQNVAARDDDNADNDDADDDDADDDDDQSNPLALNLEMEYRRLAADWQLPATPAPVQQRTADELRVQDYIEFNWAGEGARLAGNLVHRLLQLIGESGLALWHSSGGLATRRNWCRAQLATEGVKGDKADEIIKHAGLAVENCLTSEQGQWILHDHEQARCELAITAVLDSQTVNVVLDRTFIANGTRWIIDYKTSTHSGGDLQGFLDNEAERYYEQMQRYRQALALTETLPIKTALYFPLLDRLQEVN